MHHFPQGVITASLTPLNADLSIAFPKLISHCSWLLKNGSQGLALLGTTGEANSFSIDERVQMLHALSSSPLPLEKMMVGTGCTAYPDTIYLTKKAIELGFPNVLMLPPFFYKQVNERGLYHYFEKVITEIDSDRLKIFLYHFPKMSGVKMSVEFIKKLSESFSGTIVGMKDSSGDFENMRNICEAIPGFKLYAGTERFLLDVLQVGGMGCISATANVTSGFADQVFQAWKGNRSETQSIQDHLIRIRSCFEGLPFTAALKQYLSRHQADPKWAYLRPPNELLEAGAIDLLITQLEALQFMPDHSVN